MPSLYLYIFYLFLDQCAPKPTGESVHRPRVTVANYLDLQFCRLSSPFSGIAIKQKLQQLLQFSQRERTSGMYYILLNLNLKLFLRSGLYRFDVRSVVYIYIKHNLINTVKVHNLQLNIITSFIMHASQS